MMKPAVSAIVLVCFSAVLTMAKQNEPAKLNWTDLTQKPYEQLPTPDIGLKPLLLSADGTKITSKDAWDLQRQTLQKAWLDRLGTAPAKPNGLESKIESQEDQADHVRQLISFVSEADDRVSAYLLLPKDLKGGQKRPAIVVFHPTTKETLREPVGLGQRQEMALALQLVQRGYITLSPECYIMKGDSPKAQAEKIAKRRPGWTGLGKMTFDASSCADFLESLPQVDRSHIGCIGHSLGAKEVLYAMAFEARFQVGVFNEGGIGLRMSNWTDPWYLTDAMKSYIPAQENHQVMAFVAPRPFLVLGGNSADGDASWTFVKEARTVYTLLNAKDRIGFFNHKAGHAFPANARQLAYEWLDHWLGFNSSAKKRTIPDGP